MIDINAILAAALQQALAEALKPYKEQIQTLQDRVADLERNSSSEARMKEIAQEVCEDVLSEHMTDFDHEPLEDFAETVSKEVDNALESGAADLAYEAIRSQVEEALCSASISVKL